MCTFFQTLQESYFLNWSLAVFKVSEQSASLWPSEFFLLHVKPLRVKLIKAQTPEFYSVSPCMTRTRWSSDVFAQYSCLLAVFTACMFLTCLCCTVHLSVEHFPPGQIRAALEGTEVRERALSRCRWLKRMFRTASQTCGGFTL